MVNASLLTDPATWVTLAFCLVVLYGSWQYAGIMIQVLDRRSAKIREDLEEARRLRERAQEVLAKYQTKQRENLKKAEAIVARAEKEADLLFRRAEAEIEVITERRKQQADELIANLEKKAVADVRSHAGELAARATHSLITDKITGAKSDALIDQAIANMKIRLH